MHNRPHTEETKRKISLSKKKRKIIPKSSFKKGYTPWNKGKKCPYVSERNRKMNLLRRPEDHGRYIDGRSKIDKIIRRMDLYINWRTNIFNRDKYTCQECGVNKCYLTVHHKVSFVSILRKHNITTTKEARLCDELWDEENGITLCENCHSKTDNYKARAKVTN